VIQADGGTRTASITGGFLALASAVVKLMDKKLLPVSPLQDYVAAVSVGIVDGAACLDLDYREDSRAEVDMNLVMTGQGRYVEIQGTAEKTPFSREQLEQLQQLGALGIRQLVELQQSALKARTDLKRLYPLINL
jgi:ribonuclease PH